jgi:hypothetical protein
MGDLCVSPARRTDSGQPVDLSNRSPVLMDAESWQIADGVLFSVLSSLVLWSIIIASVYKALH